MIRGISESINNYKNSMIKELVQFIEALDKELKAIGVIPKGGLRIMFCSEKDNNNKLTIFKAFRYNVYS